MTQMSSAISAVWGNSSDISVPNQLATVVSGVVGLDESAALVHTDIAAEPGAPPPAAFVTGQVLYVCGGASVGTLVI